MKKATEFRCGDLPVHYFYDASKAKEAYWERAQELVDPVQEMTARQDFVRLISGQAGIIDVLTLDSSETECI